MTDPATNFVTSEMAASEVFSPVVIAPTYNNGVMLEAVLQRMLARKNGERS